MILNRKKRNKDTNSTNSNNFLLPKMVASYSIFLLAILILFFVIYQSSLNNMRNSYNVQHETTLVNNVELFETDLHLMEVYCRQLLQDSTFRSIMAFEEADSAFLDGGYQVQNIMATDIYLEALLPIKDTFCYFHRTDYILNANHFITQDRFYEWIQEYPAAQEELWLACLMESSYQNRFLLFEDFSSRPNSDWDFFMYTIDLSDLFYMDAAATVSFIFDTHELTQLFDCISTGGNGFLLVTDGQDTPILAFNENNVYDVKAITALDFGNGFASYDNGQDSVSIGRYFSANTGYTYYYSFPSFEVTANTDSIHMLFVTNLLIIILVGGFLSFYFARRNMRPYLELGQELHEAVEAQTQLQEVVDNQRPIICTSYVRKLLSGTVTSEEEVAYIRDYLQLDEASSLYNVLYIVVYNNFGDNEDATSTEWSNQEELQNIIYDALQSFFGESLHMFSPSDRTYAILLNCPEGEQQDFILKINNIVLKLHDYLLDTHDVWLFAGIGRNTNSLMNVWESYQQATEAVSYTTKNYIFFPYEFIKKSSNVFYYPPEISTKLIHFISTGNTAQVLELFNLIHQENIEERSLPVNLLKYLLSDIRNTLLKARFTLPPNTDPEAVRQLDEHFKEHLSFKLCEDLALTLCKLFTSESEDTNLATTIEKYIAQNYRDPSLGLNKISDEFKISESYFSHMFKEKTGVNFSTYLENIRMTEAARLIKETDTGLNELYIEVGYNNANTFRRAFKKVYGVTPSAMRDSSK